MGCGTIAKPTGKKIVMLGLSNSGKTALFHQIVNGKQLKPVPTLGFNQHNFCFQKNDYNIIDISGRIFSKGENNIQNVRVYFSQAKAVIYVIDSTNKNNIQILNENFKMIMQEGDLKKLPVLIFLNKIDVEQQITVEDIQNEFKILNTNKNIIYQISSCSAEKNTGIKEGLTWLTQTMNSDKKKN